MNNLKQYSNPIIPGFNPDPSIVRVGEEYYLVTSTFQYFPCITIYHSKDLIHWEIIGHGITEDKLLDLSKYYDGCGIWAPDISYYDGKFYISLCLVQLTKDRSVNVRGNYIMKSNKPQGPYSKPVQITEDGNDPSHFVDDDGSHYMLYGAGVQKSIGTKIVKLNDDCSKVIEGPFWMNWSEEKTAPEAPQLIKKDAYYYLIIAAGGTYSGHHGAVARSKNIYGPYDSNPYNPFLVQRDKEAVIQSTGHGKMVETQKGEWWIPYLCQRMINGFSQLGRETAIDRVNWTKDGWPVINDSKGPSDINTVPNLPETIYKLENFDDFNNSELSLKWLCVRNPDRKSMSLTESKGFLRIYTGNFDLDDIKSRNVIVQRETKLKYTAKTKMQFAPKTTGEEAGLVCYYDTSSFIKLSVILKEGLKIKLEEMNRRNKTTITLKDIKSSDCIYLRVTVDGLKRSFYYSYDNETWDIVDTIENCSYLSDQGTCNWGFMGTMVGMFATNGGSGNKVPADFDWFEV